MNSFFRLPAFFATLVCFALVSCKDDLLTTPCEDCPYPLEIPAGFPAPEIPPDNELTDRRVALGKRLFFDKALSYDYSKSCASCHFPEYAFSDIVPLSEGVDQQLGFRNSQALINLAYAESFFRDGGVPTLEQQVLAPLSCMKELNFDVVQVVNRLEDDPSYVAEIRLAYDREVDPFAITRAIAAFERILISGNSPYDHFMFQGVENALSEAEIRGLELFNSDRTNCSKCHSGFNFTNELYENNGLYANFADTGRARITLLSEDVGKFRVPTLRNISVTGPYMHDGSLNTLEEVVAHYESGGSGHINQSNLVAGFMLSEQEKRDLIQFLRSLEDKDFLTNPAFRQN